MPLNRLLDSAAHFLGPTALVYVSLNIQEPDIPALIKFGVECECFSGTGAPNFHTSYHSGMDAIYLCAAIGMIIGPSLAWRRGLLMRLLVGLSWFSVFVIANPVLR